MPCAALLTVGYARLSTAEQARGQALEQQIARLEEAGAERVIVDLQSGTSTRRPGYRELLELVEARQVGRVIATRLDRLSRGASETVRLSEVFAAEGAPELLLLDDPVDLQTVGGRLQMRLLGVIAAGEVERLKERSAHGKAHRKAAGKIDTAPLGLLVNSAGQLAVDERPWLCTVADRQEWSRASAVRELFAEVERGTQYSGWRWMWQTLGIDLSRAGITRLVLNPSLRGARVAGRSKNGAQASWASVEEGAGGEALIEPERHRALEARLRGERARNESRDTRRAHPLTSKCLCGHCGRRMQRKAMRSTGPSNGSGLIYCSNPACSWAVAGTRRNSVSERRAMAAVLAELGKAAPAIADLLENRAVASGQAAASSGEMRLLQERRSQLLALSADGALGMEAAIAAVDRQIADLTAAALASSGARSLDELRRSMRSGVAELVASVAGASEMVSQMAAVFGDEVRSDPTLQMLLLLFVAGPEVWLAQQHRQLAMAWCGRLVRQVLVNEKEVTSVELNL